MKSLNHISLYLHIILYFFISLLSVYVYKTNSLTIISNPYIVDIFSNWNAKAIASISDNAQNCISLVNNIEYEGIDSACQCNSIIYTGQCSLFEKIIGCSSIDAIPKQRLSKWKGSQLCVIQSNQSFFDTITIPPLSSKCPLGYKLCGHDTKKFGICYKTNTKCPMNDISVGYKEKEHYINKRINNDWVVSYINEPVNEEDKIVVDVKYSEGKVNIEKKEDERYKHFDTVTKLRLLVDNDLYEKIERYPQIDHQKLIETKVYLSYRGYIHWSPHCRNSLELSPESIINDISALSFISELLSSYRFIFLIAVLFFIINQLIKKQLKDNTHLMLSLISNGINISVLIFTVIIIIIYKANDLLSISRKLLVIKCGEMITNTALNAVGSSSLDVYSLLYSILLYQLLVLSIIILLKQINKY